MPLFRRRRSRRDQLSERIGDAVSEATSPIGASAIDADLAAVFMSCVAAGGGALERFVEMSKELLAEKSVEPVVAEFLQRLDAGHDVMSPLRVASWAYIARVVGMNWGARYEQVIDAAQVAVGIQSEAERRIATYGPLVGDRRQQTALFAKFQRVVLEAVLEAVVGRSIREKSETLPANLVWAQAFTESWVMYELMLDRLNSRR